jgi:hypothetical protein
MKTNCQKIVAVVVLTTCGVSAEHTLGQQSTRVQTPRIIHYNGDMANLLAAMSETYDTTIGLEADPQQSRSPARVELQDPSLEDVMNAIVKSVPRYQWRDKGDVIEVFPVAGGSSLLDTNIAKFQVSDADAKDSINQLLMLPEVQANMRSMNLGWMESRTQRRGKKFSVSLENVSMREALNMIAKGSGTRFWVFRRVSGQFFTISNSPE